MKVGFEALREVMVAGYRPSVARLYDPEDGQLHFSHFAAPDDCILLFMAEGNAGIAAATASGIAEIVARHQGCVPVDSRLIAGWFDDLVWGPDKITAEDERIRRTPDAPLTACSMGMVTKRSTSCGSSPRSSRRWAPRRSWAARSTRA